MVTAVVIILVLAVIGALVGGDGFFDSVSTGCGCVIAIILFIVLVAIFS